MKPTSAELDCLIHNTTYSRLLCLNDVKARLYLPVTVFLALLIVVGTVGNTTVCLVYWRRKSRVSSNYFILSLAILDLFTCVIGMPTEIADLVLPYTFQYPLACKALRFTHSSTIIASSTILIQVAFDRYYRICQLGRQFSAKKARLLCLSAVLLGIICAWPAFLLFGRKTVIRQLNGHVLKGSDCSTDDSMRRTIYPTIYYIFLFSLFGLTVAFFAVLYTKIGLTIMRRKRFATGSLNSPPTSPSGEPRACVEKVNMAELPSSDISSEQDDGVGASTASSNNSNESHRSNNSHMSTATSTTTISSILYGSMRRFWRRKMLLEAASGRWSYPANGRIPHSRRSGKHNNNASVDNIHSTDDEIDDDDDRHYEEEEEEMSSPSGGATPANITSEDTKLKPPATSSSSSSSSSPSSSSPTTATRNTTTPDYRFRSGRAKAVDNFLYHSSKDLSNDLNLRLTPPNPDIGKYNNLTYQNIERFPQPASNSNGVISGVQTSPATSETREKRRCRYYSRFPHLQPQHPKSEEIFKPGKARIPKFIRPQKEQSHPKPSQRQIRVGKTTTVLFAVTLAYILSFLPYLTVMVMRSIIKDLEENLSPVGELAYKLCVKSFFINNAINPLIYSFLNQAFRQDAKLMLKRMCRCCFRSNRNPAFDHADGV